MRTLLLAFVMLFAVAEVAHAASLSNRTVMTYEGGAGTQVEFYTGNGRTYLWFPGTKRVVQGRWKSQGKAVCFSYKSMAGGKWQCITTGTLQSLIVDTARGDVFGLSKGRAPFTLPSGRTSIKALRAKYKK